MMNTQILYVVSSTEQDYYLEQTLLSIFSLRKHNPDARILLLVDDKTDATINRRRASILNYIDNKIVVKVPEQYTKVQVSRYLKTSMRQYVTGNFFFIDSDTIIADNLNEIDNFDGDIGAVINEHVPFSQYYDIYGKKVVRYAKEEGWRCADDVQYFNSGVMFVKDSEMAHQFFEQWHNAWKNNIVKFNRHFDQPALALVNEQNGYVIKELPACWNCQILRFGLPYLHDAKILHYFAAMHKSEKTSELVYAFRDKSIYRQLKEEGGMTDSLSDLLDRAKTAFVNPTRLITSRELKFLDTDLARICISHPSLTQKLNSFFMASQKTYSAIAKIWR